MGVDGKFCVLAWPRWSHRNSDPGLNYKVASVRVKMAIARSVALAEERISGIRSCDKACLGQTNKTVSSGRRTFASEGNANVAKGSLTAD